MKKFNLRLIAIFCAVNLLFVSCTQYDDNILDLSNESAIENYDGEQIFKGIFFLEEDFASKIQILKNSILYDEINNNSDLKKNLRTASDLIITEINKKDPVFFSKFEEMMKSKNEYQIKDAINYGSKKLVEISNLIFEENGIDEATLSSIIASGNYEKVVTKDGSIDKEKLNEYLSQVNNDVNLSFANSNQNGKCLAAAVVTVAFFVAAGAVLVAGAIAIVAAINGGVLINLGAAVAVYVEVATPSREISDKTSSNLGIEMLITQVAIL